MLSYSTVYEIKYSCINIAMIGSLIDCLLVKMAIER